MIAMSTNVDLVWIDDVQKIVSTDTKHIKLLLNLRTIFVDVQGTASF